MIDASRGVKYESVFSITPNPNMTIEIALSNDDKFIQARDNVIDGFNCGYCYNKIDQQTRDGIGNLANIIAEWSYNSAGSYVEQCLIFLAELIVFVLVAKYVLLPVFSVH